jgi:hypothetical protein
MAFISQSGLNIGSLSGIGTFQARSQAVFNIGPKCVFAAMSSSQLVGALMAVDPRAGAPLSVLAPIQTKSIASGLP